MATAVIGSLRVNLGIDTAAFDKGLSGAQNTLASFGKKATMIGAGLTAGLTAPIVAFGKKSLDAFQQSEDAAAAVAAAIKSTGGVAGRSAEQIGELASKLQSLTTFDDDEILSKVSANLLTFTNITGEAFDRAHTAAVDLSARLGQDLQSSAIMLGKALNDPIKGLSSLSRVGIQFTEDQKDMIKAMAEAGDVAGAQSLILDELTRQYGGQAEAIAKTTQGLQTQAWNQWGDAMEAVGKVVAEIIPPIASAIKSVADAFLGLSPETQKWIVIAGGIAAALGPAVIAIGATATAISALLGPIALISKAILALIVGTGPIGLFIAAATAAYTAWQLWGDQITELFGTVTAWITEKFDWLVEKITGVTEAISGAWQWLSDTLVGNSIIPDMMDAIVDVFTRGNQAVVNTSATAANMVGKNYQRMAGNATAAMQSMGNAVGTVLGALFKDSKAASIAQALISTFTGVARALELPFPANLAAAAQVAAQGFAQVAAIRSTNIGSGGGGGGSASTASSAGAAASSTAAQSPVSRSLHIAGIDPSRLYGGDQIAQLIEGINDAVKDGHVLISTATAPA